MNLNNFERLQKSVIPINYDLEITPDLRNFTFKAKVIIEVKVGQFLIEKS